MVPEKFSERDLHAATKLNKRIRLRRETSAEKMHKSAKKKFDLIQKKIGEKWLVEFLGAMRRSAKGPYAGSITDSRKRVLENAFQLFLRQPENQAFISQANSSLQQHGLMPLTTRELQYVFLGLKGK